MLTCLLSCVVRLVAHRQRLHNNISPRRHIYNFWHSTNVFYTMWRKAYAVFSYEFHASFSSGKLSIAIKLRGMAQISTAVVCLFCCRHKISPQHNCGIVASTSEVCNFVILFLLTRKWKFAASNRIMLVLSCLEISEKDQKLKWSRAPTTHTHTFRH